MDPNLLAQIVVPLLVDVGGAAGRVAAAGGAGVDLQRGRDLFPRGAGGAVGPHGGLQECVGRGGGLDRDGAVPAEPGALRRGRARPASSVQPHDRLGQLGESGRYGGGVLVHPLALDVGTLGAVAPVRPGRPGRRGPVAVPARLLSARGRAVPAPRRTVRRQRPPARRTLASPVRRCCGPRVRRLRHGVTIGGCASRASRFAAPPAVPGTSAREGASYRLHSLCT
ncbi:hypothetical protein [Actinomadura sp. 6N118]|uniref:hypothetical protein n=1 Tax=Actinomadura sp. 6N118 TaxID=3375151 RepID=UPI0037AABBBB